MERKDVENGTDSYRGFSDYRQLSSDSAAGGNRPSWGGLYLRVRGPVSGQERGAGYCVRFREDKVHGLFRHRHYHGAIPQDILLRGQSHSHKCGQADREDLQTVRIE